MRVRAKISFMAFQKNKTINELVLDSINNTFDLFMEKGYYKKDPMEKLMQDDGIYYSLINDNFRSVFEKIVILNKAKT